MAKSLRRLDLRAPEFAGYDAHALIGGAPGAPWRHRTSRTLRASFAPSCSASTRRFTSSTAPSARSPSANGPNDTRISRLTVKPEMLGEPLHLAVLAFAQGKREPEIGALLAVDARLDRAVMHAVDGDALAQPIERLLADAAMRAHAIAPDPAGARQLEMARQRAVGGEQQQALGVDVEPPHRDDARQLGRQSLEHCLPALRILVAGDEAAPLVIAPQPRGLRLRQRLAVHRDRVARVNHIGGRRQHLAVDGDPARRDPRLGVAPRAKSGMGDRLGDAHGVGRAHRLRLGLARPRDLTPARSGPHFAAHGAQACR